MTTIRGAHVLVTGGSEGIGAAVAVAAAAEGATVSLVARRQGPLEARAAQIGRSCTWAVADIADPVAVADALSRLTAVNGEVDIVVNAAGFALPGRFVDIPASEFDSQMAVNFGGAVTVTREVLPAMLERGHGHLVFISSVAGLLGVVGYTSYAPTKWALRGFADSLRYEVEPAGVSVSTVYPPDTATPGFEAENLRKPPETAAVSGGVKLRNAEQVAAAILSGIRRNHDDITIDLTAKALLRGGGLASPLLKKLMTGQIRKALAAESSAAGGPAAR